jgi:endonuclease-3 related protein
VLRAWRRIPGPPRDVVKARLLRLYRALSRSFGPQRWWPGRTPFEISVGAILTQHTAWSNAARAIRALRRRRLLHARGVEAISEAELAEVIRSAGTFRLKARRVRAFSRWLIDRFGGQYEGMRRAPLDALRADLLGVAGLGPETADAILLYAAGRPVFVADAYARRVLERHRLLPPGTSYEDARRFLESRLPSDPALYNELHALFVEVGKRHCRTTPECATCPLRADLGDRGPADRLHGGPRRAPRSPRRSGRRGKAVAPLDPAPGRPALTHTPR